MAIQQHAKHSNEGQRTFDRADVIRDLGRPWAATARDPEKKRVPIDLVSTTPAALRKISSDTRSISGAPISDRTSELDTHCELGHSII